MARAEIENITEEWIVAQMQKHGIKRKNLIEDIGLEKSYLSLLFAKADNPRKIHLSKATRGLFYYYFRCKELER